MRETTTLQPGQSRSPSPRLTALYGKDYAGGAKFSKEPSTNVSDQIFSQELRMLGAELL